MIVPGVPVAGAQQDIFKPDRAVKPSAASGLAHDSLAELPVEDFEQGQHGGHRQEEQAAAEPGDSPQLIAINVDAKPDSAELPRKGLLVDIRV